MPSVIQYTARADSSLPSTRICTCLILTTASSFKTLPQTSCSSQDLQRLSASIPTISIVMPTGCTLVSRDGRTALVVGVESDMPAANESNALNLTTNEGKDKKRQPRRGVRTPTTAMASLTKAFQCKATLRMVFWCPKCHISNSSSFSPLSNHSVYST